MRTTTSSAASLSPSLSTKTPTRSTPAARKAAAHSCPAARRPAGRSAIPETSRQGRRALVVFANGRDDQGDVPPEFSTEDPFGELLESELVANVFKVGFVAAAVGAVVGLVYLATPIIDTTVEAFPGAQQQQQVTAEDED